jgi:hypothetical protein
MEAGLRINLLFKLQGEMVRLSTVKLMETPFTFFKQRHAGTLEAGKGPPTIKSLIGSFDRHGLSPSQTGLLACPVPLHLPSEQSQDP